MNQDTVIVFIVIAIPILAVFGITAYSRWLQHRQLQLMLEERKLLIEHGVTDLPPLELPDSPAAPKARSRLRNLKAGIILLFVAGAFAFGRTFGVVPFAMPRSESGGLAVILAALGVALLVIHFITVRYENREMPKHELSEQENAAVIEVDIEE